MLRPAPHIRYHIAAILAAHWIQFVVQYKRWIRPVVFENVRKVLACRTPLLGCHIYQCKDCGHVELIPHSCKSRFCPTCRKHATDVWANQVLIVFLDVPYHHLIMAIPWQLRIVIIMNRKAGLNLLVHAATESIQQWARDIKKTRMGIIIVIHTFGADMKWHPHIHLIVTGGGLSLDGKRWIETEPKFLMHHGGLKKRRIYQISTRMKKVHRKSQWRIPRRRILRFENFFDIKKGQLFVWECHNCHEEVVIPGTYKNIHGQVVKIDPKNLDPNTEVIRF